MKHQLQTLFSQAIDALKQQSILPSDHSVTPKFEQTRQKEHGDFATNLAMTLTKVAGKNPRELAQLIIDNLPENNLIDRLEIAGPGFINMFLVAGARNNVLSAVFEQGDRYGFAEPNSKQKILVEFVSANPTGPLHVGHGRGAAYGDTLARLLEVAGNQVEREYYVNDAGRQMDILAVSVWFRYLQQQQVEFDLPENAYQGDYVQDIAAELLAQHGAEYLVSADVLQQASADLEPEAAIDALIATAKQQLGDDGFEVFFKAAIDSIKSDIEQDLAEFGVNYDTWFSERSLYTDGKVQKVIEQLKQSDHLYEKNGAWWFRTTDFGDEKDRVVLRENGAPTYFASDIAYHKDKLDRGFDECIDVWGSDHHGYIARVKASLQALSYDPDKLNVLLVQFAVLYRGGEKVKMSTRSGKFVTLRELRDEVGADAARFFYAQRKSEQHMDFDLDLAKSQSNENPMYYVQYAHARICSVFRQAAERDISVDNFADADYALLQSDLEQSLVAMLEKFPETVEIAANNYEPHMIAYYLRDLAAGFHSYYNANKFIDAEPQQRNAMFALSEATRQVLANGLSILGVSAPEKM